MKYLIRLCISAIKIFYGLFIFIFNGKNVSRSYQGFIEIFCLTKGYSHEFASNFISLFYPNRIKLPFKLWNKDFLDSEVRTILNDLNRDGVVALENLLPQHVLNGLVEFTRRNKAHLRQTDEQLKSGLQLEDEVFGVSAVKAVRYEYNMLDLAKEPIVQELLSQPFFLSISASYLKTNPVLDIIQCWWHTSFGGQPDENAAQKYHFDLERLKWLKIFIYLTDVDKHSGPHCFVKASHKPGQIPSAVLNKGYSRIDDDDVFNHFKPESEYVITGKAGTIVLEDTRGLHKGMHVTEGARLMFQLQFSNSLFGAPLTIKPEERVTLGPALKKIQSESEGAFDYLYLGN